MTVPQGALLAAASAAAGVVNAIAGGGTLLTFPALLATGVSPVAANATNTLAPWAGQLSGAFAYRQHLREERRTAILLAIPSAIGGLAGSALVAALYFLGAGAARLPEAGLMALASVGGGWMGARLAQRLPPAGMRGVAISVGLYAAVRMALR